MFKGKRKWLMNLDRKTRSHKCNIIYWAKHKSDLRKTRQQKKDLSKKIKDINDVNTYISNFIWTKEYVDWDPWVITVLHRGLRDDCDGAANLGKYLFKLIGKKSDIYHLFGKKGGHAVVVTEDRQHMISNSNLVKINPSSWKDDVYNYFNGMYVKFVKYR